MFPPTWRVLIKMWAACIDYNENLPQNCFPQSPDSLHLETVDVAWPGLIPVFITLQTDFCPPPSPMACKVTPHRGGVCYSPRRIRRREKLTLAQDRRLELIRIIYKARTRHAMTGHVKENRFRAYIGVPYSFTASFPLLLILPVARCLRPHNLTGSGPSPLVTIKILIVLFVSLCFSLLDTSRIKYSVNCWKGILK